MYLTFQKLDSSFGPKNEGVELSDPRQHLFHSIQPSVTITDPQSKCQVVISKKRAPISPCTLTLLLNVTICTAIKCFSASVVSVSSTRT